VKDRQCQHKIDRFEVENARKDGLAGCAWQSGDGECSKPALPVRQDDIALFHGHVNVDKLNFIERSMIKNVKAPVGDFRDWETITSWATAIADVLKEAVS